MKKEFFGEPVGKVLNRMLEDNARKFNEDLKREMNEIHEKCKAESIYKEPEKIVVKEVQYVPVYIPIYVPVPCINNQDQKIIRELVSSSAH